MSKGLRNFIACVFCTGLIITSLFTSVIRGYADTPGYDYGGSPQYIVATINANGNPVFNYDGWYNTWYWGEAGITNMTVWRDGVQIFSTGIGWNPSPGPRWLTEGDSYSSPSEAGTQWQAYFADTSVSSGTYTYKVQCAFVPESNPANVIYLPVETIPYINGNFPSSVNPTLSIASSSTSGTNTTYNLVWTPGDNIADLYGYSLYDSGNLVVHVPEFVDSYALTLPTTSTFSLQVTGETVNNQVVSSNTLSNQPPSSFSVALSTNQSTGYPVLSYTPPSNASNIYIYRDGNQIANPSLTATSYEDSTLAESGSHAYYVLATNTYGQTASNIVTFTASAPTMTQVSGEVSQNGQVNLSWGVVSNCTEIQVFRDGVLLGKLGSSSTNYQDNLTQSGSYSYYIQANNPYGYSASNIVTENYGFTISESVDTSGFYPLLSFTIPSTATSAYLYRDGQQLAVLGLTDTHYDDNTLVSPGTYTYYIEAINSTGDTASNIVSFIASLPNTPVLSLSYDKSNTKNITLSWTSENATSYNVIKNNSVIATLPSTQTLYQYNMATATDPTFQVQAVNPYGISDSNLISYNPNIPPPQLSFSFNNVVSWAAVFFSAVFGILALFLGYRLVRDWFIPAVYYGARTRRGGGGGSSYEVQYLPPDEKSYEHKVIDAEYAVSDNPVQRDYSNYKPSITANKADSSYSPGYKPQDNQSAGYDPDYKPGSASGYMPKDGNWGDYRPRS
jgi:hypothetical protein